MSDRVKYNEGELVVTEDQKDAQSIHEQFLYDYILRRMLGDPATAVFFDTDCAVSAAGGMDVEIGTGRGFQYVSSEADADEPKFKPIYVAAAQSITVDAADPGDPRIDIVCIKAARDDADSESRYIKDGGGSITTQNVYKRDVVSFDYSYVAGVAAGAPAEPAVPAGYVKIASIYVGAGVASITAADITDARIGLYLSQPFLNLPDEWSADGVETSDATVTDLGTVSVDEDEQVMVEASVLGRKSDGSEFYAAKIVGSFYRNSAGNVTALGGASITDESNDNSWGGVDLVADAINQTVDIQVTGVAATDIKWTASVKVTRLSA